MMKFFVLISIFSASCYCCNYTNTWIILENINNSATFPSSDFQNDTFCVSTKDMNNGKAFYTSTRLTVPSETYKFEQLSYQSFDKQKSSCNISSASIQGCLSHCQNKQMESVIIKASASFSDPKLVVQQIAKNIQSPFNYVIISAHLDGSIGSSQLISYDYFNDFNFCSVFVKVEKGLGSNYAIMTTVQKVV